MHKYLKLCMALGMSGLIILVPLSSGVLAGDHYRLDKPTPGNVWLDAIIYRPIGIIRTPFKSPKDTPIQSTGAVGQPGMVELDSVYRDALDDLDGFSHIYLIYHFHLAKDRNLVSIG